MRLNSIFSVIKCCKMCLKLYNRRTCHYFKLQNYSCVLSSSRFFSNCVPLKARISQDDNSFEDLDFEESYFSITTYDGFARDLLFRNSKDLLLQRIYCCASVEELFNVLERNINHYDYEHITQTICVLYDLSKIYQVVSVKNPTQAAQEFFDKLLPDARFQKLLTLTIEEIESFNHTVLSFCVLYLNKLGLSADSNIIQKLCESLKRKLLEDFSLASAARFLETVFSESTLRPYFLSQELIPLIFNEIESCNSPEVLNNLSISLNRLYKLVSDQTLEQYKKKLKGLIATGALTSNDYKVVLQVISFLNYPRWRETNTVLISELILLIKNKLNHLNINEILLLYEVFSKTQEPGLILNDIQRCSYKYFYQFEDLPAHQKLPLFTTILYFTAPHLRVNFEKKVRNYILEYEDYSSLYLLKKILSFVKISDMNICNTYWNKILKCLRSGDQAIDLLSLSESYVNFNTDIENYRHKAFEQEMIKSLTNLLNQTNYQFFPKKLVIILNFVLLYGDDRVLLENLVTKIEQNWQQLKSLDCLKLSYALRLFNDLDQKYLKLPYARRIDRVLEKYINRESDTVGDNLWANNALLKACVYKNKLDRNLFMKLLNTYKNFDNITSKNTENIYYCFLLTNTLVPEILDNMTEYILKYKNHVLGFNAGRIIYLCYCLGYQPKNCKEFCETVVDIIIRDFTRMTGLSILYSALALAFFNKLPNSLIKSIFNVEFMDKLDTELKHCYSKDKYPRRVRNYLMQLNRAVCLDYPECNVPWFHEKYIDENIKAKKRRPNLFALKVQECLSRLIQHKDAYRENVVTPYGYEIDFVFNLNDQNEIVYDKSHSTNRLALLLIPEYAYTRVISQLRGGFQLKKRHLEILGYKVVCINSSDWINFFYPEDKMDFLKKLIGLNSCNKTENIKTMR